MGLASSAAHKPPENPPQPPVSRINLGFIGVDIIVLTTPEQITTALSSGDLKRLQDISPNDVSELPWFSRGFLSTSRFYRPPPPGSSCPGHYFAPLRSRDSPSYLPCRRYLDEKLATRRSWDDLAAKVAIAISDPSNIDDSVIVTLSTRALWRQVVREGSPDPPEKILAAVRKQVMYLPDSFNPFTMSAAREPTAQVYDYAEQTLREMGEFDTAEVPPDSVVDVAHIIFAMHAFAPTYLRELAAHPFDDQASIFSRLGLTKDTARMTVRDSTLGGLLTKEAPAYARRTLILLKIRSAAQLSKDTTYSFSGGPGEARCCGEPLYRAFFKDVQNELQKLKRKEEGEENV